MKINKSIDLTSQAFDAISKYNELLLIELLNAGADVKKTDNKGRNLLFACIDYQEHAKFTIKLYRKLLKMGSDVNIVSHRGNTPLLLSTVSAGVDIIDITITKLLLDFGANIDYQDSYGRTALIRFALDINIKGVDILLKYGANPNIETREKNTFVDIRTTNSKSPYMDDEKLQNKTITKYPHTFNVFKPYLSEKLLFKFKHLNNACELNLL